MKYTNNSQGCILFFLVFYAKNHAYNKILSDLIQLNWVIWTLLFVVFYMQKFIFHLFADIKICNEVNKFFWIYLHLYSIQFFNSILFNSINSILYSQYLQNCLLQ